MLRIVTVSVVATLMCGHALAQQVAPGTPAPLAASAQAGGDPAYEGQVEELKASGFVERFSTLGESLLLLDRQLQTAKKIDELIQVLGPDAVIEIAPGQSMSVASWPTAVRLRHEMDLMTGAAAIPPIVGPPVGGDSATGGGAPAEAMPPMISLREVMSASGVYTAVMIFGNERMRVRVGDGLPGGLKVAGIGRDWVELASAAGTAVRLTLRD